MILGGETASEMRGEILGSAPNRTFVVQWSNMVEYLATSASFNFQVRINEGGGVEANQKVEFVYGSCTNSWADLNPQVGLRGLNNTQFINRTSSGTSWLTTNAGTGNNDGCFFSSTNASIAPVSGLTFIWSRMYPVVTYTGSLSSFATCSGTASPSQTLAVSGSSLAANILITAPSGMEVSSTSPTAGYGNSVSLARSNFTVAPTPLYFRITSAASGTISGNVTISSFGATTQSIAVTGTVNVCTPGAALNFDGGDDRVNLGNGITTSLTGGTKVSVEAWVKPTDLSNSGCIVGNYSTGVGEMQFLLRRAYNSEYQFWISNGSNNWLNTPSLATPTLNVWQHVAGTWDGTVACIYVNGVLSGTTTPGITALGSASGNSVWLGANTINENHTGSIDEVRIWNVTRTQCEINTFKNCEIPTTAIGLLANYHFNQGVDGGTNASVTTLTDASASAYTGTLTNMALTGATSNWVAPGGVTSGSVTPANLAITVGATVTNSVICSGNSTTLSGTGANSYVWTGGVINAASFTPTVTNTYTVTGTNTLTGCTNTAVSSVSVNTTPTVTVNSGSICAGQSFTMVPSGASTFTYSSGTAVVSPTTNASYNVTGTSALGCVSSNTAVSSVTVNTLPVISVSSGAICIGQSYSITASGAVTYTSSPIVGGPIVTPTVTTNYSITGTDANGCTSSVAAVSSVTVNSLPTISVNSGAICAGQSFTMVPTGATTFTYSNGSSVATPTANSTYSISGTDANGCVSSVDAISSVTVNALPNISVNSGAICAGQSFTMVPTGATTFTYSNGSSVATPTADATYSVSGTDVNGCVSNVDAVSSVTVNALPTISVNSGAICAGQSFTIVPTGAVTFTYSNGSSIATPTANSTYSVSGTDANGCASNVDAVSSVTVNSLPTVLAVTNNTLLCTGETATLTASGTATSYTWSTTDNTTAIAVTPTVQTTYTVNGTDANGCVNSTTVTQDVSLCTGIVTLSNSNVSINVYPNPNNGLFILELTTVAKVTVTNALGQVVIAETFEVGKHSLDIHNEATGVYFVKVIENNKQQIIKVVKQ
jgi:hypothetical protein